MNFVAKTAVMLNPLSYFKKAGKVETIPGMCSY